MAQNRDFSAVAVAQFSRFCGTALPLTWESCATAVAMQCYCGERTVPPRRQCSAPAAGELSHGSGT
ncbi:MAG: hypothetical protein IJV06_04675 [Bacteroidaceae bacterium]|nr:hypothetical protein [Bacteroidaceae bacterium]